VAKLASLGTEFELEKQGKHSSSFHYVFSWALLVLKKAVCGLSVKVLLGTTLFEDGKGSGKRS